MDREAVMRNNKLRASNSSLDSDSVTSESSFLGLNPLDDSKLREIEELRARAAQTEQTMKWWSDCTQNWREKWSKVRTERNEAREQVKNLNRRLDDAQQLLEKVQHENKQLKTDLDRHTQNQDTDYKKRTGSLRLSAPYDWSKSATKAFINATSDSGGDITPSAEDFSKDVEPNELTRIHSASEISMPFDNEKSMRALQVKLEEAQKLINFERAANSDLHDHNEKLSEELRKLQSTIQQLTISKDAVSFELKTARQNHENQLSVLTKDLEDSNMRVHNLEQRTTTLHDEIEQLQVLNTEEWSNREQLETEKFQLEREIKKLKLQLADVESRSAKLQKSSLPGTPNTEVTELKSQIQQLHIQIGNLKHADAKSKKMLNEKTRDMELLERRCQQSEQEVKTLRNRIEQLKKEVIEALEENDVQSAQLKKVSRDLEDKSEAMSEMEQEIARLKRKVEQSTLDRDTDEDILN